MAGVREPSAMMQPFPMFLDSPKRSRASQDDLDGDRPVAKRRTTGFQTGPAPQRAHDYADANGHGHVHGAERDDAGDYDAGGNAYFHEAAQRDRLAVPMVPGAAPVHVALLAKAALLSASPTMPSPTVFSSSFLSHTTGHQPKYASVSSSADSSSCTPSSTSSSVRSSPGARWRAGPAGPEVIVIDDAEYQAPQRVPSLRSGAAAHVDSPPVALSGLSRRRDEAPKGSSALASASVSAAPDRSVSYAAMASRAVDASSRPPSASGIPTPTRSSAAQQRSSLARPASATAAATAAAAAAATAAAAAPMAAPPVTTGSVTRARARAAPAGKANPSSSSLSVTGRIVPSSGLHTAAAGSFKVTRMAAAAIGSYNIANNPYVHPAAAAASILPPPGTAATTLVLPIPALYASQVPQTTTATAAAGQRPPSALDKPLVLPAKLVKQVLPAPQAALPPGKSDFDDNDGHYIIRIGDELASRYKIVKLLGQGTFGKVVQCEDSQRKAQVAVKIIRNIDKYREASKIEIRVLNALASNDPENEFGCIHLIDLFDFRNHVCMVFELLDISVFDFMKGNDFRPFPLEQIQILGQQLVRSVAFLHTLSLVHTDLKPENILLVNSKFNTVHAGKKDEVRILRDTNIRLIDFGSATFECEYHSSVVSTRHYRAPEIILGMRWSYPCDVWSIGCILLELFTGDALFQTHDNLEHLAMMERVIGKIPAKLVNSASQSAKQYFRNGHLAWPNDSCPRSSRKVVRDMKKVRDIVGGKDDEFKSLFCDLLQGLLSYQPEQRLTAAEALNHPFFSFRSSASSGAA